MKIQVTLRLRNHALFAPARKHSWFLVVAFVYIPYTYSQWMFLSTMRNKDEDEQKQRIYTMYMQHKKAHVGWLEIY